jgi:selenocysteine-specific translation elongation factor
MPNLNVAVIGFPEYAKGIGKKSTASDITFYDAKREEVTLSLVEPSKYPEKLSSLFYASSLADIALVIVEQIGPLFGECAIMLDSMGVKKGYIVTKGYITKEQIATLTKDTVLSGYEFIEDDPVSIREELFRVAQKTGPMEPTKSTGGSVAVDHYFDVRGVGTVILGCVAEGTIKRHDAVAVHPVGKDAEIRSIQKHDDDFEEAGKGDRVGLALKGISVGELDRGVVLSTDEQLVDRTEIHAQAHLVKYWLNQLKEGMVVHLGHWMQFEPARVEAVKSNGDWRNPQLHLKLQKPITYRPGSRAVITYLEGGKLRIIGSLDLA